MTHELDAHELPALLRLGAGQNDVVVFRYLCICRENKLLHCISHASTRCVRLHDVRVCTISCPFIVNPSFGTS